MKSFKSFYEDLTFKVEVEGLPAMWMSGNSPGQVKNHLRKLVKQPSMIKSVKRQTKFDVKKMYRDKAQGKEVDEMTQQSKTHPNLKIAVGKSAQSAKDTKARADKRKANKQGTSLAAGTKCGESTVNELDYKTMSDYHSKAKRSYSKAQNSAVASHMRGTDTSKDVSTIQKRRKGMALTKSRTITKMRGEATSGEVDYGTDKSVKIMKKVTPNEACWDSHKQVGMKKKGNRMVPNCVPKNEDVKEKLTIGKIRKAAYKTAKVLGDVNAVKKGKVARRVKNRVVGKMLGKAVSKLGLFR